MAAPLIVDPDDLDTMVRTLSGECRGEPRIGQIAVAWVIRNRAEHQPPAWWGRTVGQVCRKPFQFSCWSEAEWNASNLAHMMAIQPDGNEYEDLLDVCHTVLSGESVDPTNGATHYKVAGTKASWDHATLKLTPIRLGNHLFYALGPE